LLYFTFDAKNDRIFHKIGKMMGEDNIVGGGRSRQQTAQDFYSQSNMNP